MISLFTVYNLKKLVLLLSGMGGIATFGEGGGSLLSGLNSGHKKKIDGGSLLLGCCYYGNVTVTVDALIGNQAFRNVLYHICSSFGID